MRSVRSAPELLPFLGGVDSSQAFVSVAASKRLLSGAMDWWSEAGVDVIHLRGSRMMTEGAAWGELSAAFQVWVEMFVEWQDVLDHVTTRSWLSGRRVAVVVSFASLALHLQPAALANLAEILETLASVQASRAHGFRTTAVHTVLHTGWAGEGWRPGDFRLPEDTAITDSLDAWAQHCTIAQHITLTDHQPREP